MSAGATAAARLPGALPALEWVTDETRLLRLSQDFSWFSPVLKRQLEGKRADVAVKPKTEDEIKAVVDACARERVPLTVRGAATGNYGQIVPLHGGLLLDMSAFNAFGWARGGVGRAQAGIRPAQGSSWPLQIGVLHGRSMGASLHGMGPRVQAGAL